MVTITASAAEQIRAALDSSPAPGLQLRLAARRGEDGELDFGMGLDEAREQDQEIATDAGITLLVAPPSLDAVTGIVIDYVEIEPGQMRFIFYRDSGAPAADNGPDASSGGGCGGNCSCAGSRSA